MKRRRGAVTDLSCGEQGDRSVLAVDVPCAIDAGAESGEGEGGGEEGACGRDEGGVGGGFF